MAYRLKKTKGPSFIVALNGGFVTLKGPEVKWGHGGDKKRPAKSYTAKPANQSDFKALMNTPWKKFIEEYDKKEEKKEETSTPTN